MNRTLLFGITILFALVGVSLLGGEKRAVAGFGCHGYSGCYGCGGGYAYRPSHGYWRRSFLYHSPVIFRRCHGCGGCGGCYGSVSCYGSVNCYGETAIIERRAARIPLIETPASPEQSAPAANDSAGSGRATISVNVPP